MIGLLILLLSGQAPAGLLAMEANRRALTGVVEWSVVQADGREMQFVSRFANNGDYVFENRGTPVGGWTEFDIQGQPTSRIPHLYMRNADGFWIYHETAFSASVYGRSYEESRDWPMDRNDVRDFRALGVFPSTKSLEGGEALGELARLATAEWAERRVGDYVSVTAQISDRAAITWELDPARDWSPVRVSRTSNGVVTHEAITELGHFGKVWLPVSVQYVVNGEPLCRVFVRHASPSRGDGPASFSPTDIRIEPGVNISLHTAEETPRRLTWTGSDLVPLDQYLRDVKEGKRPKPTIFDRYMRAGRYAGPYLMPAEAAELDLEYKRTLQDQSIRRHEQLWERYVREFITRFGLDQDQAAIAWRIHVTCLRQARDYVERNNKRLVDALSKLDQARDSRQEQRLKAATAAWDELQQPIQRIFEEQLKPRLEKLPTRAQRAAANDAEAKSSSRPDP
jgi:hypothetical protein